ncbi:AAA family ATPase [Alkalilimnicola sp. S0819]|uniref:AAA family ATPase n=1 Tax=Alkalilimnicola sp. S0819 TaxID=2613922 RepID=UPI001261A284|nr:ATP-binding protein [Alkalilimnicola sp. S0819]KAB7627777.1 ATP-binding protein [Alkalilimnicola sp. S0819]MPQ15403.1 AAA family ATPase [Alkalilimnicola sp. S0819]
MFDDLEDLLRCKRTEAAALDEHMPTYQPMLATWLIELALYLDWHRPPRPGDIPPVFEDADFLRVLELEPFEELPEGKKSRRGAPYYERLLKARRKHYAEAHAARQQPLLDNIRLLTEVLGLSPAEQVLLAFAVVCETFPGFRAAISPFTPRTSTLGLCRTLAHMCGVPVKDFQGATRDDAPLLSSGILRIDRNVVDLERKLDLIEGFGEVMLAAHEDVEQLLERFVQRADPPSLQVADFPHLSEDVGLLRAYLSRAMAEGVKGANVLLHGPPGVGKTELVQALAADLGADLYEIGFSNAEGGPIRGEQRLRAYSLCQRLLARRRNALLMFDEIEDVFEVDSHPFALLEGGGQGRSTAGKAWVNRALERNPVPALWVANRVGHVDPAYLRRFDYSVECPVPPGRVRLNIVRHHFARFQPPEAWLAKLAENELTTPAQMEKAAKVALVASGGDNARALEIAEQTLARSAKLLGRQASGAGARRSGGYDLAFLNTDMDMPRLVEGLRRNGRASLCFYGPPGTGKSELARYLAHECDKPLLLRRASDVLSKWVGETEQNIAGMFEQARNEDAVLLLDEADSFLADRRDADRAWEITQVNELLTQMESFDGVFICTTNLMDKLDAASLRRFTAKVRFDYLTPDQRWALFSRELARLGGEEGADAAIERQVRALDKLTPGDFAVAARQLQLWGERAEAAGLYEMLKRECRAKGGAAQRIGFV